MKWIKNNQNQNIPIKSWCENVEEGALTQALALSNHPVIVNHVALMPDCHQGYGMPIGGVIACERAVIPNAVGVDIGCGMAAVETDYPADNIKGKELIHEFLEYIKLRIPVGEGHAHKEEVKWPGFDQYLEKIGHDNFPEWFNEKVWNLASRNLGTLGGGNHFIELQKSESGYLWMMLHSGSRNLGYSIARHYHNLAVFQNKRMGFTITHKDLSFLSTDSDSGRDYIRDMNFALDYASENRKRMMNIMKEAALEIFKDIAFNEEINIHHNYAALENHYDADVWIHRKGATSAKEGEMGIIPGSMGTFSYIVKGKGNQDSFTSCSHGAGRNMSRTAANERLTVEECNRAMEGIVFDRWSRTKRRNKNKKGILDLSEAPPAYKNIDDVIRSEMDLIEPIVKLSPLGVVKG